MKYLSIDTAAVRYIEPKALAFISSSCGKIFRLTSCPLTADHAFIKFKLEKAGLVAGQLAFPSDLMLIRPTGHVRMSESQI